MYLQIMFVFLISPLFVFVFALVFLMLCCAGKYSTAGAACARHALTNYCRRSWEKLNSGHTFEFRPKNWVVLGNGTLGWPNFGKVLRNRDESAFSMTWEDFGWRESWDGGGGWCWWLGGWCLCSQS